MTIGVDRMSSLMVLLSQGVPIEEAARTEDERIWCEETKPSIDRAKAMGYGVQPVNETP